MSRRATWRAITNCNPSTVTPDQQFVTYLTKPFRNWPIPLKKAAVAAQECQ
jgi:hypothetical protein